MITDKIKALSRIGGGRRSLGWEDWRDRSPKGLGDMSGVILSKVTTQGTPAIQEFDYDLLSQVYICNDLAWTCINLVSSTVGMGKLRARISDADGFRYVPEHPIQKVLDFPNASMTQFDLLQSYTTHQLLYGNISALLIREAMAGACTICDDGVCPPQCIHKLFFDHTSPVRQIMPVHPSNLERKLATIGGVTKHYFWYVPEGPRGPKYLIHPNNFLSDPFYNPDVAWYGVSPTYMLQRWLQLDASMTKQVTDFFANGAIPSMIVSMSPGSGYTYEQEPQELMKMMKESWMERFSASSKKSKEPAFVYGDVKVEKVQENIDQAIGKGLYYQIEGRVCATYGVPQGMYEMGIRYGGRGGASAAQQQERDFFNNTISKILYRIKSKINQLVVPSYNTPGLEVEWDLSDMGIAAFLIDKKDSRIQKHWELGLLSRDAAREMLGYEPVGGELGDDFYRLTVMSDGSNDQQAEGMDNRLATAQNQALPPKDD